MKDCAGRIDVRAEDSGFNLAYVAAGGTAANIQLCKADWLLADDQEKHWFVQGRVNETWSQIYIEFIAGGKGKVSLELRGGWFSDLAADHHEIRIKEVEFDGIILDKEKESIVVWHDEPFVRKIDVLAGKRYKIRAYFKANDL